MSQNKEFQRALEEHRQFLRQHPDALEETIAATIAVLQLFPNDREVKSFLDELMLKRRLN